MPGTPIDLRRELAPLYSATRVPAFVDVPELPFLMIDGHGDPNTSPAYAEAVQALYSIAYTIRFALRRNAVDVRVMPLEGQWWTADMRTFSTDDKAQWDWTMMIVVPPQATDRVVEEARAAAARKHPSASLDRVRLERFTEGRCAQVLHVGPYSGEGSTVAELHAFIAAHGCALTGKHHEIYLGDPRRAAPEKLRTILRQPVAEAPG
jgi:hypothetical protein